MDSFWGYSLGMTTSILGLVALYKSMKEDDSHKQYIKDTNDMHPSRVMKVAKDNLSDPKIRKSPYSHDEYIFRDIIAGSIQANDPIISYIDQKTKLVFVDYCRFQNNSKRRLNRWTYGIDFDIVDTQDQKSRCAIKAKTKLLSSSLITKINEKPNNRFKPILFHSFDYSTLASVGFTDQEFGIRLGTYLVAFGDIIYNVSDNTIRMEKVLHIATKKNEIIRKINEKIFFKCLLVGVLSIGTFIIAKNLFRVIKAKWSNFAKVAKLSNLDYLELQSMDCVICGINRRKVITLPCQHLALCVSCYEKLDPKVCPVCSLETNKIEEVFIP